MGNSPSDESAKSPTDERVGFKDVLNPRCEQGNITMQDMQLGCSQTQVLIGPGAKINVDSKGSNVKKAKYTQKLTQTDVKLMKEKLKDSNGLLRLPIVSWMEGADLSLENYYIPLSLTSEYRTATCELIVQTGSTNKNELENVFDAVSGKKPKRILVESEPGFGKTTLMHKIVHDWVVGKEYVQHFELAVLVVLSHLKECSLRDAVVEELGMEGYDDESMWNTINNGNTLLLLDGLDEIGESAKQTILKTLRDRFNNKMTIICTCRTGLFKLRFEVKNAAFRGKAISEKFWDTRIKILGLTGENRQYFLHKFVEDNLEKAKFVEDNLEKAKFVEDNLEKAKFVEDNLEKAKFVEDNLEKAKMLQHINCAIAPLEATFDSPLLLILLVYVMRENPEFKSTKRTVLFTNLVDCIVKRGIGEKHWHDLGQNFSLFQTTTRSRYHDMLCKFGEMSVANILADNLQFECNDLLDTVFRMGFLKKYVTQYKLGSKVFYECFHLTFLEFAAAYSLWDAFVKNANQFSSATVKKINEILLKKGSTSTVVPFLCGLMGNDVEQFFLQFSDFCAMYSVEQRVMDSIFSECYLSEQSYDVVAKFIPKVYSIFNLSLAILTNQICMEHFSSVIVRFDELWKLTKKCCLMAKSLTVLIYDVLDILSELTESGQFKNVVKCDNLAIRMVYCLESYDQLAVQLKILFCVATDYKLLYLYKNTQMNLINESVKNNVFKNQKVDYIECHSDDWNQNYIDAIINVISHNVVKELVLNIIAIRGDHPIEALISVAASTSNLNSMAIHYPRGNGSQHELGLITSNGSKCWTHLSINEVNLTCNQPVTNLRINSLEVFGGCDTVNVDALHSFTPSQLRLRYDLFHCAITTQKSSLWAGLKSIVDLTLILGGQTAPLRTLAELHRFKNLKRLQLSVSGLLSQEQQSEIVDYLKDAVVDQLQLCWNSTESSSTIKLISALNDLLGQNELKSLKNIDFMLEMDSEDELLVHATSEDNWISCFSALISVVKCDHKVTAHVILHPHSHERDKMRIFNFIDYSQISVEQILKDVNFPYARNDFVEYALSPRYIVLKLQKKYKNLGGEN